MNVILVVFRQSNKCQLGRFMMLKVNHKVMGRAEGQHKNKPVIDLL